MAGLVGGWVVGFETRDQLKLGLSRSTAQARLEPINYHTVNTIYRIRQSQEPEYLASKLTIDNRNGKIIIKQSNLTLYRK